MITEARWYKEGLEAAKEDFESSALTNRECPYAEKSPKWFLWTGGYAAFAA